MADEPATAQPPVGFEPIERLSYAALYSKPIDFNFGEGYPTKWDYVEAVECPDCDQPIVDGSEHFNIGIDEHGTDTGARYDPSDDDHDEETEECSSTGLDARELGSEGPVMNYYYPVEIDDAAEAARLLVNSPLVVVTEGESDEDGPTGLALSGGGMDFTWDICEAFLRLGMVPPLHFCDLPGISNRDNRKNRYIIAACQRSVWVAQNHLNHTADALVGAYDRLRKDPQ